ncbi:hypothetical protein [Streptomyces xanthophaeus]|uniref:hypothetical protein n=1 Tax=Streptomyces xanthophaeus TaxID=67385 RepID=UPI00264A0BBF|nr:hypothetical protein [Streptomyces xanthophaeus]WKD33493.1 hypothetical protein KO717_17005 [Streptomyces xanthophaeus]
MTTAGARERGAPDAPDPRDAPDQQDAPDRQDARDALDDWRRDALLLCLLPVFCWPVVVAALLGGPPAPVAALGVVLSPVLFGARELLAVRRVRRLLRDPDVRWTPYEAVVVRARWRAPVLVLAGGRHALTLGLLGRRVLPPRPWPRTATAPATVVVRLAGDPAAGGALWAPHSGGLGHARPARRGRALPVRGTTGRARPLR